jgi:hypothetical protein
VRGVWPPCRSVWCHKCYRLEDDGYFPIRRPADDSGYVVVVERDRDRFLHGRAGDHWMTMFQCDLCHFRNIKSCSPTDNLADLLLLKFIRRANLDAFWSRESSTVNNNRREIVNITTKARVLGIDSKDLLPSMGPFPLKDKHGMGLAVCVLMRSLDEGKNETTIQFSTTQKMKSAFSNIWKASVHGGEGAVVVRDMAKSFHSTCPSHGEFFERFSKGLHERMGDKVRQDMGVSIELMHELMKRYEERWIQAGPDVNRQKVVLFPALFCIVAFCCALRGEEVPMMSLSGTAANLVDGHNHRLQHVVVALVGRFKNETSEQCHLMPLVLVTATGLEPGKWIGRMVEWYSTLGITTGWVFRKGEIHPQIESQRSKQSDYEIDILSEIDSIRTEVPGIVGLNVDVFEEYGLSRSFRRGSDTHAGNQGVSSVDIERNNRWRSVENAKSKQPKLRMIHHYTEVSCSLPALLRYSKSL